MYSVVLDEKHSSVIPSENAGMSFVDAVNCIIDYCIDSGYNLQADYFESILDHEKEYVSGNYPVILA